MPETRYTNGYSQAAELGAANEFHDGDSFLFSSESVGEGHPGKAAAISKILIKQFYCSVIR